jgi:diguanylate cyclase
MAPFLELARSEDPGDLRRKIESEVGGLELAMEAKRSERDELVSLLSDRLEFVQNKLFDTQARLKKTENETSLDALTGIANRRHFDRQLDTWVASHQNAKPFVLAMIDVDNFKSVNDQHGHQTGDRVLTAVAQIMCRMIRSDDVVSRYGGEEFTILFGNISLRRARERSLEILDAVRKLRIEGRDGSLLGITVSCGLAMFVPGDTSRSLLQRADHALYDAKQRGRNRVETRKSTVADSLGERPALVEGGRS